ncbi:hypothetical protein BKA58DRAFT_371989 [Alternaria rosae]|uniref:uncharacterized protein n=1 Tax=Alternaria rosae TaxID=1187941 RepID=UPI001E8ECF30|nr:uncharacterized protein BKA58DRAFT_371989 [Alternaria rosae]KAH6881679.1 hypothetical protein BKA58DRAFT_371989 [Alternaria rosae]
MKLSIVAAMLFASLAAAEIRYFCLKGGDAIPRDEWSCSTADNRACQNRGCVDACFPGASAVQVYRVQLYVSRRRIQRCRDLF